MEKIKETCVVCSGQGEVVSSDLSKLYECPKCSGIGIEKEVDENKNIIKSKCKCGEPISVELNSNGCRLDGKRPFYPDEPEIWNSVTVFSCRKCKGWLGDTCEDAAFDDNLVKETEKL